MTRSADPATEATLAESVSAEVGAEPVPLLEFDDLTPELRERLRARVDRLGYLGDFFRVGAHQPAVLDAFIAFTEAGKQVLPTDQAELIALTAATYLGVDYERNQHERLSIALGLRPEWIREVEQLDPDTAALTPAQRAVQRWVLAALASHGRGAEWALRELVRTVGVEAAVAVMFVCGRYAAHALIVNSCGITPPVASIFEGPSGAQA